MKAKRQSNRPDRRIQQADALPKDEHQRIAKKAKYARMAYHKLHPGDYRFHPPVSARPSESVCDDRRVILKAEAGALLRQGILNGVISRPGPNGLPEYVWAVDTNGEVYEAKTGTDQEIRRRCRATCLQAARNRGFRGYRGPPRGCRQPVHDRPDSGAGA
jgi:hypothetical protein